LAKDLVTDPGDRPIFIFAKRVIEKEQDSYLVTGDKIFFSDKVRVALHEKVKRTKEILDLIE
jgi:hypothetical protein